jgi:nitroimidazol reductase NimA-like FMN-containing flavoprotein (pyridoxamine 5'-phosphate oxidase superfamily)
MYRPTEATTPTRLAERARYDAETVHSICDEATIGHLGFVADRRPHVLPMLFVRAGSTLYLHSSTGARPARMAARRAGLEVTFEATIVDALVLARSAFHHSANYRAVVAHGTVMLERDEQQKRQVLAALVDKLVPGRSGDVRDPTAAELRKTAVLALPLEEVSAKIRTGPPLDDPEDLSLPYWAGTVPLTEARGTPHPSADLRRGIAVPGYLRPQGARS